MSRTYLAGLVVLSMGLVVGCSKSPADSKPAAQSPAAASTQASGPADEIQQALAKLPEADRKLAEAQKTCPVGGAALGSMDTPFKAMVKASDGTEHAVFLCCEGCKEELEKDPDKYLAKMKAPADVESK